MGLSLVTAGVITTSVLPTNSVEAAEYRKIYADVTAQMGLDGNLYLEVVGDRSDVSVSSTLLHSFEVLEAESGEIGVELALKYNPQVVILDVMLPGMGKLRKMLVEQSLIYLCEMGTLTLMELIWFRLRIGPFLMNQVTLL